MAPPFSPATYQQRRQQLLANLGQDSLAIVPAAIPCLRNGRDNFYPYRQNSDFWYLTGFAEADSVLVLDSANQQCTLFCRGYDAQRAAWEGAGYAIEEVPTVFGLEQSESIDHWPQRLVDLLANRRQLWFDFSHMTDQHPVYYQLQQAMTTLGRQRGHKAPGRILDLATLIHPMRLFKDEAELAVMRRAAAISVQAHQTAMEKVNPAMGESHIHGLLLQEFTRQGACEAYPSIVAGGANACILHYDSNNQPLKSGDLLLIDAGAELHGYASDLTRTFPVNGRFSDEQRALYNVVLAAQQSALQACQPGRPWQEHNDIAQRTITEGLQDLGILQGNIDDLMARQAYRDFYWHRIGHWLGLDTHDVGGYQSAGQWQILQENMVLTVEPGIYINPNCQAVDERWRGIGIRIEDDVRITSQGHEIFSQGLVKNPDDIEQLMA